MARATLLSALLFSGGYTEHSLGQLGLLEAAEELWDRAKRLRVKLGPSKNAGGFTGAGKAVIAGEPGPTEHVGGFTSRGGTGGQPIAGSWQWARTP